ALRARVHEWSRRSRSIDPEAGGDELPRRQLGDQECLHLARRAIPVAGARAVVAQLPGIAQIATGEDADVAVDGFAVASAPAGGEQGAVAEEGDRGEGAGALVRWGLARVV